MPFNVRMSTGSLRSSMPEIIVIDSDSDDQYDEPLPEYTPDPDRQPGGRLNPIVID